MLVLLSQEAKEGKISLEDDDAKAVDLMIYYLYHLDYHPSYPREQSENDVERKQETDQARLSEGLQPIYPPRNELIIHTKVYVLAEKYLIDGLKALALRKFNEAAIEHWASNDLLEATQVAYQSTVDTDKGIRDAVVRTFYKHPELLDKEEVQDIFRTLPLLAYDLMMYVRVEGNWPTTRLVGVGAWSRQGLQW